MASFPPPSTAPAGWYPDPSGRGQRYFDGLAWAGGHPGFSEPEEHPSLPLGAALGALVVLVLSLLIGKSLVDWLVRYDWPVIAYVIILAVLGYGPSVVWGAYVRKRWGAQRLTSLGWRFRWSDLGWGPLTWVAAVGTQVVTAAVVLILDVPLSSNVESAADLDADRAYLIATLVTAVVAAPVIEELVFRGLVLRGLLSRMRPAVAIALQGVLFGVAHVDPVRGVGNIGLAIVLSGVGIAFGTSAFLTRRLGPTVIAHAIFNGVVMAIVLSGVLDDVQTDLGALVALLPIGLIY
jgi:membrane protease YdiL (CAAX protease family)